MAMQPIVRGDFVYNDTFFAEVGESKRHPRASVAELSSLLRPETTKAPAPKDQVGHWYEAQLLHYGLQRSKDKNTAKVRLLQAINAGTLAVPGQVSKLEKDMKKEFVAQGKKKAPATTTTTAAAKGKKRTHEEASSSTKVTITVGGVTIQVDQETAGSITSAAAATSTAKRTKKTAEDTPSKGKKKKDDEVDNKGNKTKDASPKPKAATTKKSKDENGATKSSASAAKPKSTPKSKVGKPEEEPSIKTPAQKKQTARRGTASSKQAGVKHDSRKEAPQPKKQTARYSGPPRGNHGPGPVPRHLINGGTPNTFDHTPTTWPNVKSEEYEEDEDEPGYGFGDYYEDYPPLYDDAPQTIQVNGTYQLWLRPHMCSEVAEIDGPPRLSLHHDTHANTLWGSFTIGKKSGVIKVTDMSEAAHTSVHFGWRSQDMMTGKLRFGQGCNGMVQFNDAETPLKGTFYGLLDGEDVDFASESVVKDTIMEWPSWKDGWADFVHEAYG